MFLESKSELYRFDALQGNFNLNRQMDEIKGLLNKCMFTVNNTVIKYRHIHAVPQGSSYDLKKGQPTVVTSHGFNNSIINYALDNITSNLSVSIKNICGNKSYYPIVSLHNNRVQNKFVRKHFIVRIGINFLGKSIYLYELSVFTEDDDEIYYLVKEIIERSNAAKIKHPHNLEERLSAILFSLWHNNSFNDLDVVSTIVKNKEQIFSLSKSSDRNKLNSFFEFLESL